MFSCCDNWPLDGAGAEMHVNWVPKSMSTFPICGRLAEFYTVPCTGRQKWLLGLKDICFPFKDWSSAGAGGKMLKLQLRDPVLLTSRAKALKLQFLESIL